ncbi:isopeptide-forming domain-containing fimbrial protein, partial [Enterococcus hirae]
QELFKLEVEEPDGTWKDVTSEGKIVFDESTEKLSWQLADGSILAGKNYRATFGGTLKEDGDYGQFVTEDGKIMIPNVAKQIVGTQEKETPQADVEVPDIDQRPVKSVLDKNGKETELTSGKKGENVSFTVKNTAPYASKGQSVTLSDDLENVLDLQEKEVKVEVKNGDQWEDITSQGTFTNNAEEEIVSWTLADGSVLAGKEYRMTITGTLKKDVDYSAYMDKTGNILIPNVAKETIGTKEKATNQVQVAVQQEKPTLLPATGVRQTKESNVLPVFASVSVLSIAGYFFVKGRR